MEEKAETWTSISIASLGAATANGDDLGAVATAFVLLTAIASPITAKLVDPDAPAGRRLRLAPTRKS